MSDELIKEFRCVSPDGVECLYELYYEEGEYSINETFHTAEDGYWGDTLYIDEKLTRIEAVNGFNDLMEIKQHDRIL